MLPAMDILSTSDDAVELRLTREEATALYQLLVEAEAWPGEAVGARLFVRRIREGLSAVAG
jgi:hypothetical protein